MLLAFIVFDSIAALLIFATVEAVKTLKEGA